MKNEYPSIDGFVRRRTTPLSGTMSDVPTAQQQPAVPRRRSEVGGVHSERSVTHPDRPTISAASIHESLESIDNEPVGQPKTRREKRRAKKAQHHSSRKRKIIKWVIIAILAIAIGTAGFLAFKALVNLNSVFSGDLFGLIQRQPLKEDKNGRSNVLIFSTEAPGHPGANLTDSIMVLSVNQTTKDAYMVSLPRDLWVDFDGACMSGYQGKLNEVYSCGSDDGKDEPAGAAKLRKKAGMVLGLDIQYYVHVDFASVKKVVDAVGGVDVTIESNPKGVGILDRNFDWVCNYQCHFVKYRDGERVNLDGEHALALARARNANGGYGLAAGNFDREKNQQKIMKSLREKALSAGTLADVGKVASLMDALGENFKTNIDKKEVQTIMALASDMQTDAIKSLTLVDEANPLVKTGPVGQASAVYPVAGMFDYSQIHAYIVKHSSNNPIAKEEAKLIVLNGSGVAGLAQKQADKLAELGMSIERVANAPKSDYTAAVIYRLSAKAKPKTEAKLIELYGGAVKAVDSVPGVLTTDDTDYVVIIAKDTSEASGQ